MTDRITALLIAQWRTYADDLSHVERRSHTNQMAITMLRQCADALEAACAAEPERIAPDFWRCRTCGCLWRDNHDDTVSLGGATQVSCPECEMKPTPQACEPLFRGKEAACVEPEPSASEEVAVAMLAACEATIRHLWDIAAHFPSEHCNRIRDEIHRLNMLTLPAIRDLQPKVEPEPAAWQSIATAPKDGSTIILCSPAFRNVGETKPLMGFGSWQKADDDAECDGWCWSYHLYPVTHWMPLPDPPTGKS